MDEPEMMELQDASDENMVSFIVFHPTKIRKEERTLPFRVVGAGLLGMLCALILFIIVNLIFFAAQPPPVTEIPDGEEHQIFIDLDLDNPVELEDLMDLDDIDDIDNTDDLTTPQLMDEMLSETSSSLQDPTLPVLVFYRPAKTPSRLPSGPGNMTPLSSSLSDPHPARSPSTHFPPVTTTCTEQSPCTPTLPPYRTPHVTLFTKINNRFVAITASTASHSPTRTTPTTTPSTTTTATPPATTTTTASNATTTTATSASTITVTVTPYTYSTVASPLNTEPVYPSTEVLHPEENPATYSSYNKGAVVMYVLLAVLMLFLLVVLHEMVDLNRKEPWSLWMADAVRTVGGAAVRRRVQSRYGNVVALRTLRQGNRTFFQVTDANPTSRNPHRQSCCPPNCGVMHAHHHHLPRENPDCHNPRSHTRPGRH